MLCSRRDIQRTVWFVSGAHISSVLGLNNAIYTSGEGEI